jgi:hypothetical protein
MTTNLRDLALTPRATAVLVALRKGPRSIASIADALADLDVNGTTELLVLMASGINGDHTGPTLVQPIGGPSPTSRPRYCLTHDGLGWLQSKGLDATATAKQALYYMTDLQQASKAGVL